MTLPHARAGDETADEAADEGPRVEYRAGAEFAPPAHHGRFELTLRPDGGVRLEHRQSGMVRRWSARVEAVVWPRLVDALRRSEFPRTPPPGAPGRPAQELLVTGVEPAGEVRMRWGDGAAIGLTDARTVRIWDAERGDLLMATKPVAGFVNALVMGVWRGREAMIAADADGSVLCWGLPGGDLVATARLEQPALALALAPTGELWALGTDGPTVVDPHPPP